MIPRLSRFANQRFAVRRCGPVEYALRVLSEMAGLTVTLAVLEWLPPLGQMPGLTAWPGPARGAFIAACAVLTVVDVALLRVRRNSAQS